MSVTVSQSMNVVQRPAKSTPARLKILLKKVFNFRNLRGFVSLLVFVALWQLVVYFKVPYLQNLPYPRDVAYDAGTAAVTSDYWINWGLSLMRIFIGFIAAQIVGIPLGLAMGISRTFKQYTFPLFEILRPIPPIAWIPLAILFWPTRELLHLFPGLHRGLLHPSHQCHPGRIQYIGQPEMGCILTGC